MTTRARATLRADLGLLRQRRFALLFTGRTVAMFGTAFGPMALAFGVLSLPGATPVTLSVVLTGHAVPQLGLMLLGGVIGDRLPRYRVLVAGQALSGLAFGGMAAMLLGGRAPVAVLTGFAVLAGCASALLLPALTSVVPDVVGRDRLQPANALLRLGSNTANLTGLAGAGVAVALLGPGTALLVTSVAYLIAAGLLRGMRPATPAVPSGAGPGGPPCAGPGEPASTAPGEAPCAATGEPASTAPGEAPCAATGEPSSGAPRGPATGVAAAGAGGRSHRLATDLRAGFHEFTSRQWLWVVVLSAAVLNAGTAATFGVLGPVLAVERLGGAVPWSAIMIGYSAGTLVSVVVTLHLRPVRPLLAAALATPLLTAPLVALGTGAPLGLTVAAAAMAGVAFNVFGVLWETTVQQHIPPGVLARVISFNYLIALSVRPLGIFLAGHLAALAGAATAILVLSVLLMVAGLSALASPAVRHLTTRTEYSP